MATRTVTGTIYGIDGSPLEGKRIVFSLLQLGVATGLPVYPQQANPDPILTDALGEFSIDLWVNADSEVKSIYKVVFHDDTSAKFIIPSGAGSIDISDLIINYGPESTPQDSNALSLKADRDAGNLTVDDKPDWRLALSIENVDNTSDADKPISDATQLAIDAAQSDADAAQSDIDAHVADLNNPHQLTADQINLGTSDEVAFAQVSSSTLVATPLLKGQSDLNGVGIGKASGGLIATFGDSDTNNVNISGSLILGDPLSLANGGTGGTSASSARVSLELGSFLDYGAGSSVNDTLIQIGDLAEVGNGTIISVDDSTQKVIISAPVTEMFGSLTLGAPLAIEYGGTGASDAPTARSNLGITIQTTVSDTDTEVTSGSAVVDYAEPISLADAWAFSNNTTSSNPGSGGFKLDNATQTSATNIYISDVSVSGETKDFSNLAVGDQFRVTSSGLDSILFRISGDLVDNAGWHTIPVEVVSNAGTISNNARCVFRQSFGALRRTSIVRSKKVYTGTATTDAVYLHVCDSSTGFTLTVSDGSNDGQEIKVMNRGTGTVALSGKISTITALDSLSQGETTVLNWDVTTDTWE